MQNVKQNNLKNHGQKPYKCEKCHKAFAEKSHRNRHSKTHREEKSYKVRLCEKWLEQTDQREKRKLEVFGIPKSYYVADSDSFLVKPFGCVICNEHVSNRKGIYKALFPDVLFSSGR